MTLPRCHDFWDLVALSRTKMDDFRLALRAMTEQELVDFYWKHAAAEQELIEAGLADHMETPPSEDAVTMLAEWIVGQGIDYYDEVLEDMTRAPRRVPQDLLDLRGMASAVYLRRFDADMRYPDEPPPGGTASQT